MKNLIFIFFLILIVSCNGNTQTPITREQMFHARELHLKIFKGLNIVEIDDPSELYKLNYFEKFPDVDVLLIDNIDSLVLPENIDILKQLSVIKIYGGSISYIPNSIKNLMNLKYIRIQVDGISNNNLCRLTNNKISKYELISNVDNIPEEFWNQENLETLAIENSLIVELSNNISKLKKLKELRIISGKIKTLPQGLQECQNIEKLLLFENELDVLPECIGFLKNLKELNANDNNIKKIEFDFSQLTRLETLELAMNKIQDIPVSIERCTSLKILYLPTNNISKIPEQVFNIPKLEIFNFANNKITEVPDKFTNYKYLKEICLCRNEIVELPVSMTQIPTIVTIDVSNNPLKTLIFAQYSAYSLRKLLADTLILSPSVIKNIKEKNPQVEIIEIESDPATGRKQ